MEQQRLKELLDKYADGQCTPDEVALLESWYLQFNEKERVKLSAASLTEAQSKLWAQLERETRPVIVRRLWPRIAAAASILLVLSFSAYFAMQKHQPANVETANDIKPGSNGAILTLANGQKIVLEQTRIGAIAQQNGTGLKKAADSLLVYQAGISATTQTLTYNTLETPRGKQYRVILPDGTQVMLNAASKLTYPTTFTGKERLVELSGEAWFKVVHNAKQPFKIKTGKQITEDIGTEFNINAYTDEPAIKTTLIEGSIRVVTGQSNTILKPGQQSVFINNNLAVNEANLEEALAWKNGYFQFESESIQPIMRKIARWYDVEVVYTGNAPTDKFWGTVSRFGNVSQVLKKLELTNKVHFKIEGRRIMVSQ